MQIVLASNNENKIREVREILGDKYEVISQREAGADFEVIEDTGTFAGNAMKKAREVCAAVGRVTISDDSGLCVEALGGEPGVDSALYAGKHGDDDANNRKLLSEMEGIDNRRAYFICVIAVAYPDGEGHIIEAKWHGEIAEAERGENGFAYDKLFVPEGDGRTSAELEPEEKNRISHRAGALRELKEFFEIKQAIGAR